MTKNDKLWVAGIIITIFFGIPAYIEVKPMSTSYFDNVKYFINEYWFAWWLLWIYFIIQSVVLFISRIERKREISELEQLKSNEREATRNMIYVQGKYDATRTAIWQLYGLYINSKHRDTDQEYLWEKIKSSFAEKIT
jgi:hypothetical protein